MLEYFFYGILAGFGAAISFGPAFIAITETSVRKGVFQGIFVALGVSISDIMYVVLFNSGFDIIYKEEFNQNIIAILGGTILIGFGVGYLLKKKPGISNEVDVVQYWQKNVLKGFIINGVNPYVPLFWAGVVATTNTSIPSQAIPFFFVGLLSSLLLSDTGKSWIASRFNLKENYQLLYLLQRAVGTLFVATGVYLIVTRLQMI